MRKITKVAVTTISIALTLSLSSCYGSGPNAATRMITRVTDGNEVVITNDASAKKIDDDAADLRAVNLLVVATDDGAGVLVGTLVNRADETDQILGISINGVQAVISGEKKLVANKPVRFEGETANAKAVFPGVNLVAGTHTELVIGFARAGLVKVNVIVRDTHDIYAGVTSGAKLAVPAASPSATPAK
jgi:hypothetical protein